MNSTSLNYTVLWPLVWSDIKINLKKYLCIWFYLGSNYWLVSTLDHSDMKKCMGVCSHEQDGEQAWTDTSNQVHRTSWSASQIAKRMFFVRPQRMVCLRCLEKGKFCTHLQEKHRKDNSRNCRLVNLTLVLGKILDDVLFVPPRTSWFLGWCKRRRWLGAVYMGIKGTVIYQR